MTAAWAAVLVSAIMALAGVIVAAMRMGQREGKIDQCIVQLTKLVADHEGRIRVLESKA